MYVVRTSKEGRKESMQQLASNGRPIRACYTRNRFVSKGMQQTEDSVPLWRCSWVSIVMIGGPWECQGGSVSGNVFGWKVCRFRPREGQQSARRRRKVSDGATGNVDLCVLWV